MTLSFVCFFYIFSQIYIITTKPQTPSTDKDGIGVVGKSKEN